MATAELRSILKTQQADAQREPVAAPEIQTREFDATNAIARLTQSPTTSGLQSKNVTWEEGIKHVERQSDGKVDNEKKVILVAQLSRYLSQAFRRGYRLIRVMHGNTENLIYVQKLRDPSQFGVASILNLQTGQISTFAEKDLEVVVTSAFNALPAVFVDAMSEVPDNFQNAYLTLIRSARGTRLPKFHQVARKLNENYAENKDLDAATKALLLQIIDRKGIAFEELFHFNRDIVLRLTDLTLGLIRTAQIPAKFGDLFVERVKMQAQNPNYFKRLKFEKITQEEALALDRVIRCSSGELKPSEEIARIAARFENAYLVNESVELAVLFRKCLFALDEMGYAGIFEELLPGEKELYLEGDHCDFDFNEIDSDLTGINIEALIQDFFRQISLGPVPELEDIQ